MTHTPVRIYAESGATCYGRTADEGYALAERIRRAETCGRGVLLDFTGMRELQHAYLMAALHDLALTQSPSELASWLTVRCLQWQTGLIARATSDLAISGLLAPPPTKRREA